MKIEQSIKALDLWYSPRAAACFGSALYQMANGSQAFGTCWTPPGWAEANYKWDDKVFAGVAVRCIKAIEATDF